MISFHSNQCNENKSVILYKIVWPLHKQLQSELTFTNGDRKHEEDVIDVKFALGIKNIYFIRDVKFASGIQNIKFGFYPYTDVC